jgi:hypothetical protein
MSVLSQPAYIASCLSREFGLAKEIAESCMVPHEPAKIPFDSLLSVSHVDEPSFESLGSGKMLNASAALHVSDSRSARPSGENTQSARAAQSQRKLPSKRRPKRCALLQLASHLNELQSKDPDKILMVRKINRLGFDSAPTLKKHFEQFGLVDTVRLSNAHQKEPGGHTFQVRLRPSGIGFVVFENSEAAARVMAEGETHIINGVEVHVRAFERRNCHASESADEEVGNNCGFEE